MPKVKTSWVYGFFDYNTYDSTYVCLCKTTRSGHNGEGTVDHDGESLTDMEEERLCGAIFKSHRSSNLELHMKRFHRDVYDAHKITNTSTEEGENVEKSHKIAEKDAIKKRFKKQENFKHDFKKKKKTTKVVHSKEEIINGIVELIAVNGRPLSIFADTGFRRIVDPLLQTFSICVNRESIKELIEEKAASVRKCIQSQAARQLVSIKIDCVTIRDRLYMGVNLQKIAKGRIFLYTLGTVEISVSCVSNNLKTLLMKELRKFKLSVDQLYSVIVDNATDMIKMAEILPDIDTERCTAIDEEQEEDNDEENAEDRYNEAEGIVNSLSLSCLEDYPSVICIRCIAHTLQLSICDTLCNIQNKDHIEHYCVSINAARTIVKALRASSHLPFIKRIKKPLLDCAMRWDSTYEMLCRLLELKDVCVDLAPSEEFHLEDVMWQRIQEVVTCLRPAAIATTRMQNSQLVLSDVYKIWRLCRMEMAQIGVPFSNELVNNMMLRQRMLFENEIVLCAVFLDPRFNFELTDDEKEKAINYLYILHNRYHSLQHGDNIDDTNMYNNVDTSDGSQLNSSFEETEQQLERLLQRKKKATEKINNGTSREFYDLCSSFLEQPRLKIGESVLEFWEKNKNAMPELYSVSQIVYSAPATQTSTERLCSQLKFILNNPYHRTLSSKHTNDILLLKSNFSNVF